MSRSRAPDIDSDSSRVIALIGPTASGKTAVSLALAEKLGAEIVSLDSSLVYRGMDIGTAKPSRSERARVAHHLIDICEPTDIYSAARFCHDALCCFNEIHARGRRVLLTGGTMLYLKALISGLAELPGANAAIREGMLVEAEQHGWPWLHAELAKVDPVAAERIHPNDPQRVQRALEVYRLTGHSMSALQQNTRPALDAPPRLIAMVPESRAWLHRRIEQRFTQMLEAGFVHEAERLRSLPGLNPDHPSMRCVGYRQVWRYLEGTTDLPGFRDEVLAATRQLAKRQLTWLRSLGAELTLACDELPTAALCERVVNHLGVD